MRSSNDETARVHHAARRRGGDVAAWGAGAETGRMRRIGVLMPLAENDLETQRRIAAFAQALQDMGWSAGRTLVLETRYADGKPEPLPLLANELVRSNVDVIVTQAAQPVEAAIKATSTIPIVMASVGDAVGGGYVGSLARPGGNVTGQTLIATGQSAKRLQLLKDVSPDINRVAVIWDRNASGHRLQFKEMEAANRSRAGHRFVVASDNNLKRSRSGFASRGSGRRPSS